MSLLSFFGMERLSSKDPLDPWWYSWVSPPVAAGVSVNERTAMTLSDCWSATMVRCGIMASLPLNLMRRTGGRVEIVEDDPRQQRVKTSPNDEMGAMMFRSTGANFQVNAGNFYAEIQRFGNDRKLWPIHSSRVEPKRDKETKRLFYRVRNDDLGGKPDDIPATDMLHVPSPISSDGICGKGVIENARETIGAGLALVRHRGAYFGNGARPGIIIEGGKFGKANDEETRDTYRRMWMDEHGGPKNHGKPALLPEGAKVTVLPFNAQD